MFDWSSCLASSSLNVLLVDSPWSYYRDMNLLSFFESNSLVSALSNRNCFTPLPFLRKKLTYFQSVNLYAHINEHLLSPGELVGMRQNMFTYTISKGWIDLGSSFWEKGFLFIFPIWQLIQQWMLLVRILRVPVATGNHPAITVRLAWVICFCYSSISSPRPKIVTVKTFGDIINLTYWGSPYEHEVLSYYGKCRPIRWNYSVDILWLELKMVRLAHYHCFLTEYLRSWTCKLI